MHAKASRLHALALIAPALVAAVPACATTFQTLHSFANSTDGAGPAAGLAIDGAGLLYGTTTGAGAGLGTVFEFDPATRRLTTLHAFTGGADGSQPRAAVVFQGGLLYGTTFFGGGPNNDGTAFAVDPAERTFTPMHAFNGSDGSFPSASFAARAGSLYSTTFAGGPNGFGTVFKLTPASRVVSTVGSFPMTGGGYPDGAEPEAGVVFDASGSLYGTTSISTIGNTIGFGTVFKLNPASRALTKLHAFTGGADGGTPAANMLLQGSTLYGTTTAGGNGYGEVFKLVLSPANLTPFYTFSGGNDGASPVAGLVLREGAFYGTTKSGGVHGYGTVFKLVEATRQLITLHAFAGGADGANPEGGVVFDASGALYGTTYAGGTHGFGTVFKLVP